MRESFVRLQREWYKKLRDGGFYDLECLSPDGSFHPLLKGQLHAKPEAVNESKRLYFEQCSEFLHNYKFKNRDERLIFEMHTDGHSMQKIAVALGLKSISISRPFRTIKRLRLEMLKYFYGKARKDRFADLGGRAECA